MTKFVAFLLYLNVSYITHCLKLYLNQMENELCMAILVLRFQSMIVVEYIIIVMGCCMSSNWTSVWNGCVLQIYQSFLTI